MIIITSGIKNCPSRRHFHSFQPYYYFYMPVLVMAIADPAAALAGQWYQRKNGFAAGKTIAGSLAFFSIAFVITFGLMMMFKVKAFPDFPYLLLLLGIPVSATGAEYFSRRGWDNFFIPLVIMIIQSLFELIG